MMEIDGRLVIEGKGRCRKQNTLDKRQPYSQVVSVEFKEWTIDNVLKLFASAQRSL